jgi:hypothetical protein
LDWNSKTKKLNIMLILNQRFFQKNSLAFQWYFLNWNI